MGVAEVFRHDVGLRFDRLGIGVLADLAPEAGGDVDTAREPDGFASFHPALPLASLGWVDSAHIDQVFYWQVVLGGPGLGGLAGGWLGYAGFGSIPRHGRYLYHLLSCIFVPAFADLWITSAGSGTYPQAQNLLMPKPLRWCM